MKTILNTLFLSAFVLCELPPPYPQRRFKPSPQFSSPQTQYGPPKLQSINTLNVEIPSRLTIEQLIRLTEHIQSSQERIVAKPQTIRLNRPQSSYLPPPRQPQRDYGPPSNLEWSQSQLRPPPPVSNFGISQLQNSYGSPPASQQNLRPQNQYGPPPQTLNTESSSQSFPQTSYGVPSVSQLPKPSAPNNFGGPRPQIPPSTSYGVPDLRSIETLGQLRNQPQNDHDILRENLLKDLRKQHLPYREPTGFRPQGSQNTEVQNVPSASQQYLGPNSDSNSHQSNQGAVNQPSIPQSPGNQGFTPGSSPSSPQNVPNQQYLPANNGNSGQSPQSSQSGNIPNQQYLSANGGNVGTSPQSGQSGHIPSSVLQTSTNGENNLGSTTSGSTLNNNGQNYLPPQTTTPRADIVTRPATPRPRTVETPPVTPEATTNYDYDYDIQQPTESPTNQDGASSDPNVAVSNAVAGGGGFFYLQQPDGRLQRVVLQKTQEPNSKPEEYIANYYFQNVQALPAVTYAPLVSLAAWR